MFFDTASDLLAHKRGEHVHALPPTTAVAEAVRLMNRHDVGAVVVINGSGLEGILTERDVLQRVVEPGRDPASTRIDEVMTRDPRTVHANDRAARVLDVMTKGGFRHVPVLNGDEILGVLSMRDLNCWLTQELRDQADGALMAVKTMGLANRGR
jgi:CBS domain-containing protein